MAEIALAAAIAVLKEAISVLCNQVVKEGSRLFKLTQDMEWIEKWMGYMQDYLEDADANNHDQQGGSKVEATLLNDIRVLACDAEDIVETYFHRIATGERKGGSLGWLKSAKFILNYKTVRDLAVEIEGIKRRIEDIKNVRQAFPIRKRSGREDTWHRRRAWPHIDEAHVVGFDEHIKELVTKVLNEDLQHDVISIIGMAGLGKTTVAKKVYNSVREKFQCSAWIYVSQQPNISDLLRNIAGQVGLEKEKWEHNFEASLFEFLSHKRYVIVVDDLWETKHWDCLKIGIPHNSESGSRIILTSRKQDVGVHVGGESSLHELQPLDPENSRNLFFTMVRARGAPSPGNVHETSDPLPLALENIGEQILKRCRGVPLAIVVTAGLLSLRDRTTPMWNGVLERMGQDEDQYSDVFALSYKDLPTKLKPCFLYFGLFPEDHEISAFELINFWAAEGFIRGSERREVEDVGDEYLNHLIARNLIQLVRRSFNGRVRSCRIHDILHSLCIRVANETDFFHIEPSNIVTATHNLGLRVRRVATHHSIDGDCICLNHGTPSKLRVLMCSDEPVSRNHGGRRVKNSLRDFTHLRALSYKRNFFLPYLIEVGNLRHLSYLALRGYRIELPSTIRNLKSLLTLDVRKCSGVILPTVIWNMKQLKHILLPLHEYVRWSHVPKSNEQVPIEIDLPNLQTLLWRELPDLLEDDWLRKLTDLRTLRIDSKNHSGHTIEMLSGATPVLRSLEKLNLSSRELLGTLGAPFYAPFFAATLNLSQYENLCKLHLGIQMCKLPQLDKLPPNLIKLTLENTYLLEDPMGTLKRLPKLKILKLRRIVYCGSEIVRSAEPGNFPQLEVLKMDSCGLVELIVEEGGMPKLKEFIIHRCSPTLKIPDRIKNIITRTERWNQGIQMKYS